MVVGPPGECEPPQPAGSMTRMRRRKTLRRRIKDVKLAHLGALGPLESPCPAEIRPAVGAPDELAAELRQVSTGRVRRPHQHSLAVRRADHLAEARAAEAVRDV